LKGVIMIKHYIYRLYVTCPAKHTTYIDYKTKKSADRNFEKMRNKEDWYATHIEKIRVAF